MMCTLKRVFAKHTWINIITYIYLLVVYSTPNQVNVYNIHHLINYHSYINNYYSHSHTFLYTHSHTHTHTYKFSYIYTTQRTYTPQSKHIHIHTLIYIHTYTTHSYTHAYNYNTFAHIQITHYTYTEYCGFKM